MSEMLFKQFTINGINYLIVPYVGDENNIIVDDYHISFNPSIITLPAGESEYKIATPELPYNEVYSKLVGFGEDYTFTTYLDANNQQSFTLFSNSEGWETEEDRKLIDYTPRVTSSNTNTGATFKIRLKDGSELSLLNHFSNDKEGGVQIGEMQTIIKSDANSRMTIKPSKKPNSESDDPTTYTSIQIDGSCMSKRGEDEQLEHDLYGNGLSNHKIKAFGTKTAGDITHDIPGSTKTLSIVQTVYNNAVMFDLYPVWNRIGSSEGYPITYDNAYTYSTTAGTKVTNAQIFGKMNKLIVYTKSNQDSYTYVKNEYVYPTPFVNMVQGGSGTVSLLGGAITITITPTTITFSSTASSTTKLFAGIDAVMLLYGGNE